ncbi:MAG: hypothetical protein RML56_04610 [Burkholderiales bacterium]|nr:hypothetical protein [Burkholderiales bacterium]
MKRVLAFLGAAAVLAASAAASAQPPMGGEAKGPGERHRMREHARAAHEACRDAPDRGACLRERMCEQAADPARCRAEAAERRKRLIARMEARQAMHEACAGKRGEALLACLGEQRRGPRREPQQ